GGVGVAAGSQQRQAQDQQTAERVGRLHVIVTSEGPSVVLDSPPGPSYWAARRQCNAAAAGFRPGCLAGAIAVPAPSVQRLQGDPRLVEVTALAAAGGVGH